MPDPTGMSMPTSRLDRQAPSLPQHLGHEQLRDPCKPTGHVDVLIVPHAVAPLNLSRVPTGRVGRLHYPIQSASDDNPVATALENNNDVYTDWFVDTL